MSCWTKEQLENMLYDVVSELDLSDGMLDEHGPLGTAPSKLVRLVLDRKNQEIDMLKRGFVPVSGMNKQVVDVREEYDCGNLNDYGGGNVSWWQDYIRAEVGRANEFYASTIGSLKEENERLKAEHKLLRERLNLERGIADDQHANIAALKARVAELEAVAVASVSTIHEIFCSDADGNLGTITEIFGRFFRVKLPDGSMRTVNYQLINDPKVADELAAPK